MNILFLNTTKGIQTNAHFNHHHCSYYKKIVHNNMNNTIFNFNIYKVLVSGRYFQYFLEVFNYCIIHLPWMDKNYDKFYILFNIKLFT